MKKTPLQVVKEEHGGKVALADKLIPMLDRREDEDDEEFTRRIRTASNKKLLRLWTAEQRVKSDFGSKEGLVDKIVELKFGRSNDAYRAKIARFAKTRLLDLHDQLARKA